MLNIMGLKSRDIISIPLGIPDVHVLSLFSTVQLHLTNRIDTEIPR